MGCANVNEIMVLVSANQIPLLQVGVCPPQMDKWERRGPFKKKGGRNRCWGGSHKGQILRAYLPCAKDCVLYVSSQWIISFTMACRDDLAQKFSRSQHSTLGRYARTPPGSEWFAYLTKRGSGFLKTENRGPPSSWCCCLVSRSCLTLQPHGLQHARLPCPSLSPRACSNSRPLSWWCYPAISFSVAPFSSCPQSFPASGSFLMSWLFVSSGQNIWSFRFSISPSNEYSGLIFTGLISLQSKGLSRVFSSTTIWKHQFFGPQPSFFYGIPCVSDGKEFACNVGDPGSIPGSGKSLGEGEGCPLQYSCPENSMGRRARQATVYRASKSWTCLSD